MTNEAELAKEKVFCECGHEHSQHSLYMGVQGDGMCCADGCDCESFASRLPRVPEVINEPD